ncbi:LamG-like jellyroll fold domain-containing protein [Moorena sp. SIO3H5]|uniref:LamG-like jellyroll fold domain-containing protein n=1 Tax=Moorena sp. SIO3H5 TaxID=2607834 RepID=UPI0013BAE2F2|nr:LamG-like jellyroll fold domain-containing protein [Moorena sp. SIO3H5]NEO71551.1 hypothetical protein [Moorena sp. SIO3H5]
MSELIVKLNLDYQDENGQLIDSSGNDYSVTTDSDTAPTLVDDSQFFTVASFDGTDDFISLPDASTLNLTSNSFSVEAWVYIADSISDITSSGDLTVLGSLDSTSGNVLQLTIRNGSPHMGFTGIETTASDTTLIPGTWYHLAWVYDAEAKTQTIYLNGAMIAQGTDKDEFTGTSALRVGQWTTGPTFFDGKMAMLRIYYGVLSVADIKRDMYQDNPSYTFNSTYPIDFSLFDKDEANTLYIEDEPADQVFILEIYNHATETITWQGSDSVSSSNYHFALKFRPQTLAEESLSGDSSIALSQTSGANWQLLLESDENQRDVVYLLSTNESTSTLAPGETLSIELKNVGASGSQGARGTQVELVTDNITYSTDPDTVLQLNRVNHLSVINHRGEDDIPLHVGFVGPNTVLNDGSEPADATVPQLVLRLTNTNTNTSSTQGNDVNFLLKDDDADTSKIIINFDTDTENNSAENVWALGSSSLVGAIEITPPDNWTVEVVDGEVPEWILRPSSDQVLAVGDKLEIDIGNIVTSHPTGPTHVYINYQNIPGYWDGKLVAVIQKQPLVFYDENVGIGVAQPSAKLEVAGSFSAGSISTDGSLSAGSISTDGSLSAGSISTGGSLSAGSISTNSILSGERELYTEAASSIDYRSGNNTTEGTATNTGLCYRVASNPQSQEPIFQVRSSGQAVRLFVEHDGWTGSGWNAAWFSGSSRSNYFGSATQIGGTYDSSLTASTKLYVDGDSQITGDLTVANVGIGTTTPRNPLAIRGQGTWEELISFEDPEGTTKWHINQNIRGENPGLNFVETNVADGRLFIQAGGNVGIGTTNPQAKLEVNGQGNKSLGEYNWLNKNTTEVVTNVYVSSSFDPPNTQGGHFVKTIGQDKITVPRTGNYNGTGHVGYSIYASERIACSELNVYSDERIKKDKVQSNSGEDLEKLLKIKITDYSYIDPVVHGIKPQKKVLGQQIAEVYPQAVNIKKAEVVPDIMRHATSDDRGEIILENHGLEVGDKVQILYQEYGKDKAEFFPILEVKENSFRVDITTVEEVFIYGREVDDFHTVDYEAISMLNVSATQELYKRIEGLTEENQKKDLQIQELTQGLDKQHQIIQSQQETIEKMTGNLQQVMQRLEVSLVNSDS